MNKSLYLQIQLVICAMLSFLVPVRTLAITQTRVSEINQFMADLDRGKYKNVEAINQQVEKLKKGLNARDLNSFQLDQLNEKVEATVAAIEGKSGSEPSVEIGTQQQSTGQQQNAGPMQIASQAQAEKKINAEFIKIVKQLDDYTKKNQNEYVLSQTSARQFISLLERLKELSEGQPTLGRDLASKLSNSLINAFNGIKTRIDKYISTHRPDIGEDVKPNKPKLNNRIKEIDQMIEDLTKISNLNFEDYPPKMIDTLESFKEDIQKRLQNSQQTTQLQITGQQPSQKSTLQTSSAKLAGSIKINKFKSDFQNLNPTISSAMQLLGQKLVAPTDLESLKRYSQSISKVQEDLNDIRSTLSSADFNRYQQEINQLNRKFGSAIFKAVKAFIKANDPVDTVVISLLGSRLKEADRFYKALENSQIQYEGKDGQLTDLLTLIDKIQVKINQQGQGQRPAVKKETGASTTTTTTTTTTTGQKTTAFNLNDFEAKLKTLNNTINTMYNTSSVSDNELRKNVTEYKSILSQYQNNVATIPDANKSIINNIFIESLAKIATQSIKNKLALRTNSTNFDSTFYNLVRTQATALIQLILVEGITPDVLIEAANAIATIEFLGKSAVKGDDKQANALACAYVGDENKKMLEAWQEAIAKLKNVEINDRIQIKISDLKDQCIFFFKQQQQENPQTKKETNVFEYQAFDANLRKLRSEVEGMYSRPNNSDAKINQYEEFLIEMLSTFINNVDKVPEALRGNIKIRFRESATMLAVLRIYNQVKNDFPFISFEQVSRVKIFISAQSMLDRSIENKDSIQFMSGVVAQAWIDFLKQCVDYTDSKIKAIPCKYKGFLSDWLKQIDKLLGVSELDRMELSIAAIRKNCEDLARTQMAATE